MRLERKYLGLVSNPEILIKKILFSSQKLKCAFRQTLVVGLYLFGFCVTLFKLSTNFTLIKRFGTRTLQCLQILVQEAQDLRWAFLSIATKNELSLFPDINWWSLSPNDGGRWAHRRRGCHPCRPSRGTPSPSPYLEKHGERVNEICFQKRKRFCNRELYQSFSERWRTELILWKNS